MYNSNKLIMHLSIHHIKIKIIVIANKKETATRKGKNIKHKQNEKSIKYFNLQLTFSLQFTFLFIIFRI